MSNTKPIVICGPSGAGKGTLIAKVMEKHPKRFGFAVSHTTRLPRVGEENGVHYHFVEKDNVIQQIKDGMFIESAEVHGNVYGTSFATVQDQIEAGRTCILDIDVQGVRNVKASDMAAHYVFIAPPSMALLEERLRARGTEKEEAIVKRLANAQGEMDYGSEEGAFDVTVVNNDLETASVEFVAAIEKLAGIV